MLDEPTPEAATKNSTEMESAAASSTQLPRARVVVVPAEYAAADISSNEAYETEPSKASDEKEHKKFVSCNSTTQESFKNDIEAALLKVRTLRRSIKEWENGKERRSAYNKIFLAGPWC
jgi:hypothetical protein